MAPTIGGGSHENSVVLKAATEDLLKIFQLEVCCIGI